MAEPTRARGRFRRLRIVGALLAVLFVVLLGRALALRPAPVDVPAPPSLPDVDARVVASHLGDALRHATVFSEDDRASFTALHATLRATYPAVFETLEVETVDDASLLLTWRGRHPARPPIVLAAHQDVVPVEPGTEAAWTHDAYAGAVADGFVWGRGAIDCKLGVVGLLEATSHLLAAGFEPSRTIVLAFGHDEEVGGGRGARAMAARLDERGVRPWLVLDEGGVVLVDSIPGVAAPVALVGVAEKGYASVELVATSDGGHSTMPPAHTSIGRVAAALARLEASPRTPRIEGATAMMVDAIAPHTSLWMRLGLANRWLLGGVVARGMARDPAAAAAVRTTTAITMFDAGVQDNVLAAEARAVVNFRLLPGDTVDDVLVHVREVIDDDTVTAACLGDCREATPISDPDGEEFGVVETSIRQVFGDVVVAPNLVVGGTDARHYHRIAEAVYRFLPVAMGPDDRARVHGTDERISVEHFERAVRFYMTVMKNAAG